jgi:hypothetical protein
MDGVDEETGKVEPFCLPEAIQEDVVDLRPHASLIPVSQPTPASHATATAHLLRQEFPRDSAFEDKDNACEGLAVADRWTTAFGTRWPFGDKRFDHFPE